MYQEDLLKKRRLLDAELRKTRQEAADIVKTWDQELAEFSARRCDTDARLAQMEAWLVVCANEVEVGADDDVRIELELGEELREVTEQKAESAAAVAEFQTVVDAARRAEACVEQDKKLEANFIRALGDIDEDVVKKLLNLQATQNPARKDKTTSRASQNLRAAGRRVSRAGAALRAADKLKSSRVRNLSSGGGSMIAKARTPRPTPAPPTTSCLPLVDPFHGAAAGPRGAQAQAEAPPVEPLDPTLTGRDPREGLGEAGGARGEEDREGG